MCWKHDRVASAVPVSGNPLSANMVETPNPRKFSVEGETGSQHVHDDGGPAGGAETEVTTKAQPRRFTAAEKLRVLREADRCTKPGELSALLRREGL